MYPWYKGYVEDIKLTNDDTQGIQSLYPSELSVGNFPVSFAVLFFLLLWQWPPEKSSLCEETNKSPRYVD